MAPYRAFIKAGFRDRVLYLYREPSAIYAVFGACRPITLAPVKLHLLCLETPRQSSTSYKVVILQENCNWRQSRQKMEEKGEKMNVTYTNPFLFTQIIHMKRYTDTKTAVGKHSTLLYLTGLELLFLYPLKAKSSFTPLKELMRQGSVLLCKAFSSQVDFCGFLFFVGLQGWGWGGMFIFR